MVDEAGNITEITIWELPHPLEDKLHGYKYSLLISLMASGSSATTMLRAKGIIDITGAPKSHTDFRELINCLTIFIQM